MNATPLVSIIVAVYNGESTIIRCLESIAHQTLKDIEVIVVNDGSTDGTQNILEEFAKKDNRFVIINKANQGVAKTRQIGIDNAHGIYTIHVDCDDWIESNMIQTLYDAAEKKKSDIVICDLCIERPDKTEIEIQKPTEMNAHSVFCQLFKDLHGSLCNKLIRKDCYDKFQIKFPTDVNCCEDLYVVMNVLSNGVRVSYVNKALYHYDKSQNEDSITNRWLDFPVKQRVRFIEIIEPLITTKKLKKHFNNYIAIIAFNATKAKKEYCPNYRELFLKYTKNINESELPFYKKTICFLYMNNIPIPIRFFKKIKNKTIHFFKK